MEEQQSESDPPEEPSMPSVAAGTASPRGRGRLRGGNRASQVTNNHNNLDSSDTVTTEPPPPPDAASRRRLRSPYVRRSTRADGTRADGTNGNDKDAPEVVDSEEKLISFLKDALVDNSRQRIRATHMSLRRYGTVDNRVSQKDLQLAFQENQIDISNRLMQMMTDIFEDQAGVDYERLYKCIMAAHLKTESDAGRDSVKARLVRNDLTSNQEMSREEQDRDFLYRLEEQLVKDKTFFDIPALRKEFQSKDVNRTGKITKETMFLVCDMRTPLYGALLKNLLKRCDEDRNNMISWPEFLSFLEKSQEQAWKICPELAELPEKARQAAAVVSNPIEELSTGAKSRVVSRLLQKATLQKEKSTLSNLSREKSDVSIGQKATNNITAPVKPANQITPKTEPTNEKPTTQKQSTEPAKKSAEPAEKSTKVKESQRSEEPANPPVIEVDKPSDDVPLTPDKHSAEVKTTKPNTNVEDDTSPDVDIDENNVNSLTLEVHGKKVKVVRPETYKDTSLPVDPPQERLTLDWVYGYRGNDCRSNLHILGNDDILYFISNIAVMYRRDNHSQRHYREHTSDIKCIAVHSNGNTVASGQFSSKKDAKCQAHIRIWRADTLTTAFILGMGSFDKAVMCLAFHKQLDLLAAVDNSQEKKLSIWDTADGSNIANIVLHVEVICDVAFNPVHQDLVATIGKEHIGWWRVYPDSRKITCHAKPDYDSYLRAKFVICLTHTDKGDLVTGDSNGTVYVWGDGGNKITNFIKHGHDGPVFTVLYHRHHLVSGGRDGIIYCWQWTKNMDCAGKLEISRSEGGVRLIQTYKDSYLVGTTMNSILSIDLTSKGAPLDGATLEMLPLTQGHFDELRGLVGIPKSFIGADFLTAGVDGIICKFNTEYHQPVWKIVMKGASFLCADCSIDGRFITLGTHDGHLVILELDAEDMSVTEVMNKKISRERLDSVRLAPDCGKIAIGGHDRAVYVFALQEKEEGLFAWEMAGKCKGHRGPVTAIDWSKEKVKDTHILRSSSAVPEQFFWHPETCSRVEGRSCVSLPWLTSSCTLDYTVTGVWCSKQAKEAQINTLDINPAKTVIAMGDNSGCLSLFRYPCPKDGAFSHTYRGHQNMQTVRFSPSGSYILTVGGRDSCVMQWRLV